MLYNLKCRPRDKEYFLRHKEIGVSHVFFKLFIFLCEIRHSIQKDHIFIEVKYNLHPGVDI